MEDIAVWIKSNWDWIMGSVFVFVYAYHRFSPDKNAKSRSLRYRGAALLYVAVNLVIYGVLLNFPVVFNLLLEKQNITLLKFIDELSRPYFAALLLTVLLPAIPWFSYDGWLRAKFLYLADVPGEVRRISRDLFNAAFVVPRGMRVQVRGELVKKGFFDQDINYEIAPGSTILTEVWTKVTALMCFLENLSAEGGRLCRHLEKSSETFATLRCQYAALSQGIGHCLRLHRDISKFAGDVAWLQAISACTETFEGQARNFFRNICDFLGRGMVEYCSTANLRGALLREMGFPDIGTKKLPIDIHKFITLFLSLTVIFLAGLTSFASRKVEIPKIFAIVAVYMVAVFWAVYPKDKWKLCSSTGGHRPVAGYCLSGLLAAITGAFLFFLLNLIVFRSLARAIFEFYRNYPWVIVTFTASSFTAYSLDNNPNSPPWIFKILPNYKETWLRWCEGLSLALLLMLVSAFIFKWLISIDPGRDLTLGKVVLLAGSAGFIIGVLIPNWYRKASLRENHTIAGESKITPENIVREGQSS